MLQEQHKGLYRLIKKLLAGHYSYMIYEAISPNKKFKMTIIKYLFTKIYIIYTQKKI